MQTLDIKLGNGNSNEKCQSSCSERNEIKVNSNDQPDKEGERHVTSSTTLDFKQKSEVNKSEGGKFLKEEQGNVADFRKWFDSISANALVVMDAGQIFLHLPPSSFKISFNHPVSLIVSP